MTTGVGSMQETFEKVGEHETLIHQDILPQLKEMRKEQDELAKEMGKIALSQSSLELTVMKDGQQTRELLGRFVDHYFGTDDKKLVMKEKVTLKQLSLRTKIILGLIAVLGGSGGILAGVAAVIEIIKN
ncbi:MAG: hypothetical protein WAM41_17145 [Psychrobacillus psychrotolerans]|uniref:hypothetical protein n=1 Tax=Psychrobacillus psychrotolerans TaxID=126156 RepID=UPI003BAFDF65